MKNIDSTQQQTQETFAYKWSRRGSYESKRVMEKNYRWLVERYFGSEEKKRAFMAGMSGKNVLDAGCGSGFTASLLFGETINKMTYLGVDISDAIVDAASRFKQLGFRGEFLKDDISTMALNRQFDVIYSDGVLHHASRPREAFENLVTHLAPAGMIMFYVYNKKAVVREFTDDMIRERLAGMTNQDAWEALMPLTRLGKALGDADIEIDIQEDIPLLDIPKGKYNLQRLIYYYFFKAYYDPDFNQEEMNHINFDWYRPLNCFRFSPAEIHQWLETAGLRILRFNPEESGMTVVAVKE